MNVVWKIFKAIIHSFFPNTCAACGDIIDEGEHLCSYCHEMISRCDPTKRCTRCGHSKKQCECNKRVFLYDGCIAPFYNDGPAKSAMYKYKFSKRLNNAHYFAQQMALSIKTEYRDIHFDGITYVPLSRRKRLLRGFDQCYILAKEISEILEIPFLEAALMRKNSRHIQHETSYKERFENVKGLYSYCYKNTGRVILLLDDIKTTGATLQECSKQLLLSGADRVYCVTGLITNYKEKPGRGKTKG